MSIDARFHIKRKGFILDVDLDIPCKGITAVFGPSGCGKTTLLRAIAGLEHCNDGFLQVGEAIWQDQSTFLPAHKRAVGYVFQEASLFDHLTVQQNLQYGVKRVPLAERRVSLDQAIELLGIAPLLNRQPRQLSGGERQRIAIARVIAVSPAILLMDEPLAALDFQRKQEIMPYLESLHEELEIPLIYVSHSPDEVARLADHMVLLEQGKVQATGDVSQLLTRLDLPLAHGDDAGALIEAKVARHDDLYKLTYIDFSGGRFTIGQKALPEGHIVRLRVAARDVSLTLQHQSETSILNIFPAVVEKLSEEGESQMMVRLSVNGVPLLSRLTRKSAALLDLHEGKAVFAQVKTVALLS